MKKYKLLKDLPVCEAGTICEMSDAGDIICPAGIHLLSPGTDILVSKTILELAPEILTEWFEEVKDEWRPWRAGPDETYWYVDYDGGSIYNYCKPSYDDYPYDGYDIGNHFQTEAEAKRALAKLEAYTMIKRDTKGFKPNWSNRYEIKWSIHYDISRGVLDIDDTTIYQNAGVIYFAAKEDVERSLDKHRKEWELLFDLDKEKQDEGAKI